MRFMPQQAGGLHFIGIGGIGMSGLAELMHALGYKVQGSDAAESVNTKRLAEHGISVKIGHDAAHLDVPFSLAAVVVSSAIKSNNPELQAAYAQGIPVVHRADILAGLMRQKWSIGVAGTHGKTTTTSMLGTLLEAGLLDPSVINGGIVNAYGTNVRLGNGDWLVAETDESDGSFLKLPLTAAIITNIDPEHMEHYGSEDALQAAYVQLIEQLPFYGFAAVCVDHPTVRMLYETITDRRLISYGFADDAAVQCFDIRANGETSVFSVRYTGGTMTDLVLATPGRHNVQNATGAIAIALELGLTEAQIRNGLQAFRGVKRRFTTIGTVDGIRIIDDYAHHPAEIAAVLQTARSVQGAKGRVLAVMQPHRYTRLSALMPEFADVLKTIDAVAIADVYSAGEPPIDGVNSDALAALVPAASRLNSIEAMATWIKENARTGDMVLCLGAGSISAWAYAMPDQLGHGQKAAA